MKRNDKNPSYLYCTAIIRATEGTDYEIVKNELLELEEKTNQETGCIQFFISPLNPKEKKFALWEIWEDDKAFYEHHKKIYTQELFAKKITEIVLFESSRKVSL